MGPFVGVDAFQVRHMAHDGIFIQDAVGAKNRAGLAADFQSHVHVVHLRHADLRRRVEFGILEATQLQRQ